MKKSSIIVIVLLIMVIIIVLLLLKLKHNSKAVNISNIENLDFYYTQGYMANSDVRYEIKCKEECVLIYKPLGFSDKESKKYKISSDVILEVENLLNKYSFYEWNGFHESDKNVLDGDSFGFFVTMNDGDKIQASGYMSWPKNYGNVKRGLESIFEKVIK